jgi:hypothetical protein
LHPGAQVGNDEPEPQQPKIAIAKGGEDRGTALRDLRLERDRRVLMFTNSLQVVIALALAWTAATINRVVASMPKRDVSRIRS